MSNLAQIQFDFPDSAWQGDSFAFAAWKAMAKGIAESEPDAAARLHLAQSFCGSALNAYWQKVCERQGCSWKIRTPPVSLDIQHEAILSFARAAGAASAVLPVLDAGYLISSLYTVMLPEEMRSGLGAYYTPPALVERLLDMVTEAGFDWEKGRILDPACGGGAFLAPAVLRMLAPFSATDPAFILRNITTRLHGFEIDPFAAWVSLVVLEVAMLDICRRANKRLPDLVEKGDALAIPVDSQKSYDLVIGNPPYGKVTLPEPLRHLYKRSLYGHANLYGLFTDLAVRWVKAGGVIGYVTPTSFLGGQYFKALRGLLKKEAPPVAMDFVTRRQGVFEDVLQETMLTVYRRAGGRRWPVTVHFLEPNSHDKPVLVQEVGKFKLPAKGEEPWFLPRDPEHTALLKKLISMPHRLTDYGFAVNTGQLVWNRHKGQLRTGKGRECYPLVWAESVTAEGRFSFSAVRRSHTPYFNVHRGQDYLITKSVCVLVQRTTAKEQKRRLIAALLPEAFLKDHGGVVVENHLNMIKPLPGKALISPATIAALLNTKALDLAFRCISGSVAVSAYELNTLPLPSPEQAKAIETLIQGGAPPETIETLIARIYGME
jgi:hypothetical protein